jgi:hypothetical protein
MVTKTTFSERDFFDEIYEHAQESTQSDKEIKVTLSFARECKDLLERRQNVPRGDREIMFDAGGRYKDEWRYPPRMLAYMTFMHTFGRTSILRQGFAESDHALTLYVHPRKFVDFYRRRYGIEPSSTNQVTQRSTKIHIYIDSKIGLYTFRIQNHFVPKRSRAEHDSHPSKIRRPASKKRKERCRSVQ